jgi:hypothetical protein
MGKQRHGPSIVKMLWIVVVIVLALLVVLTVNLFAGPTSKEGRITGTSMGAVSAEF